MAAATHHDIRADVLQGKRPVRVAVNVQNGEGRLAIAAPIENGGCRPAMPLSVDAR